MKPFLAKSDLGNSWFATVWSDGSMTIQSPDKGQRIDLPKSSADLLRDIFTKVDALEAEGA